MSNSNNLVAKPILLLRSFVSSLSYSPQIRKINHDLPYFSQWETPQLVEEIVTKRKMAADDPQWEKSGAVNQLEYTWWSWNACGMACFKMLLAHRFKHEFPIVELGKRALKYGCYKYKVDCADQQKVLAGDSETIAKCLPGLFYAPCVDFAREEFGLEAQVVKRMVIGDIIRALEKGQYVIVSVSPEIRKVTAKCKKRGGHLVLMTGYDLDKKELYLHNPSGFYGQSQEHFATSFKDFKRFFGNRGIIIS